MTEPALSPQPDKDAKEAAAWSDGVAMEHAGASHNPRTGVVTPAALSPQQLDAFVAEVRRECSGIDMAYIGWSEFDTLVECVRAERVANEAVREQSFLRLVELERLRVANEQLRTALAAIVDAYPFRSTGIFGAARAALASSTEEGP